MLASSPIVPSRRRTRHLSPANRLAALVAAAVAFVVAACGSDDVLGRTVESVLDGDVPPGAEVELETRIISPVTGADDGEFAFFVAGADDSAEPLRVVGATGLAGADAGDVVRIVGVVDDDPTGNGVVVDAETVSLVEEGQLDEGRLDDKTDAPDPTEPDGDDPVTDFGEDPYGEDADIPSGGEGVPQAPAGDAGAGAGPEVGGDRTNSGAESVDG